MSNRIRIKNVSPAAYKAMMALEAYLQTTRISPLHQDMIRIRASQINGCAYCIDMHSREARALGETEQRIYGLMAWEEMPFYTEEEKAILALTDAVTLIHNKVSDQVYERAAKLFDEEYLAQVIMAVVTINAWNRIGVSTRMSPE
ncbi:hypothetical protein DLD77_04290 [Chitinophaga alhagiae]|uniref:Carboxymuconolactone decarboxylase-like domain-containing protein n=1 Tax=Chitinophaga alhagiae TaxID=2203219 RepID=A0ABM6WAV3_9BACT|nr:carboxymuconolactone decarboxylase family protein [Chitinophaga alhagiae]AWO00975.1 hypothetical protein DLD77_04290 [Chitinophaga alhagiae]